MFLLTQLLKTFATVCDWQSFSENCQTQRWSFSISLTSFPMLAALPRETYLVVSLLKCLMNILSNPLMSSPYRACRISNYKVAQIWIHSVCISKKKTWKKYFYSFRDFLRHFDDFIKVINVLIAATKGETNSREMIDLRLIELHKLFPLHKLKRFLHLELSKSFVNFPTKSIYQSCTFRQSIIKRVSVRAMMPINSFLITGCCFHSPAVE